VRVPEIPMPEGRYFSLSDKITAGTGGQTRALLMRNRLLAQRSGVEPTLLTFDSNPDYPQTRAALRDQGQLVDPMRLLNIFEWHRENDIDQLPTIGEPLPEVTGFDKADEAHPDGSVYVTKYGHSRSRNPLILDFRRRDGSVFARVPADTSVGTTPATDTYLVNSLGQPVGKWPRVGGWRRQWIMSLAEPGRPVFIFSDSRYELAHILPMPDERFYVMHLMHNIHLRAPRQ